MKYVKLIVGLAVTLFFIVPIALLFRGVEALGEWIAETCGAFFDKMQEWSNLE